MLVIHGGMPKTGTTAFQYSFAAQAEALASVGVHYPAEFRNNANIAHHPLVEELRARLNSTGPLTRRLFDMLREKTADGPGDTLISSEGFTNLVASKQIGVLLEFLHRCLECGPVRFVLSLRRIDEVVESMYLHGVKVGRITQSPDDYLGARTRWPEGFFRGLAAIRDRCPSSGPELVKYGRDEGFVPRFFDGLGFSTAARKSMGMPESNNVKLGLKGQTLLRNLDGAEERLGRPIRRPAVIAALERGDLTFDLDITDYSVMNLAARRDVHLTALREAASYSISPYLEAFSEDNPKDRPLRTLSSSNLTNDDFDRLKVFLEAPKNKTNGC